MKILGGKHFKTPGGEFVELKSGTQYAIHVKKTVMLMVKVIHITVLKTFFNFITMSNWGENILSDFNGLLLLTALPRSC